MYTFLCRYFQLRCFYLKPGGGIFFLENLQLGGGDVEVHIRHEVGLAHQASCSIVSNLFMSKAVPSLGAFLNFEKSQFLVVNFFKSGPVLYWTLFSAVSHTSLTHY